MFTQSCYSTLLIFHLDLWVAYYRTSKVDEILVSRRKLTCDADFTSSAYQFILQNCCRFVTELFSHTVFRKSSKCSKMPKINSTPLFNPLVNVIQCRSFGVPQSPAHDCGRWSVLLLSSWGVTYERLSHFLPKTFILHLNFFVIYLSAQCQWTQLLWYNKDYFSCAIMGLGSLISGMIQQKSIQ